MPKRIIVGISGASGVIYGVRLLEALKQTDCESHLIISDAGRLNIEIETDRQPAEVEAMADVVYDHKDIAAAVASGSYLTAGMVVAPCTIRTLSAVANSRSSNLVERAADVTLKERRPLVLVARETPLSSIHLQNMLRLSDAGAIILPANPGFYHHPDSIDALVDFVVARILDQLRIEHTLMPRWGNERGTDA